MCEKGNQTIYRECTEKLKKQGYRTNQEMRTAIKRNGGCMVKFDKKKELVLN